MQVDEGVLRGGIARKQLSLTKFARKAGLSCFSVNRALKGRHINFETLGKLAAALDIDDPTELLLKPQEAHNG